MRRLLDEQPQNRKLFSGREFMRLMTMIVMLGLVWSLITTARNPSTWKFLAQEAENDNYTMSELRKLETAEKQVAIAGFMQSPTAEKPAPATVEKPAEPTPVEPAKADTEKSETAKSDGDKTAVSAPAADKAEPTTPEAAKARTGKARAGAPSAPAQADVEKAAPVKVEPAQVEPGQAAPAAGAPAAGKADQAKTTEEVESLKQMPQRKFDDSRSISIPSSASGSTPSSRPWQTRLRSQRKKCRPIGG